MKISQIVLASTNMGKVAELAELLAGRGILVRPLSEFPGLPEIEETGSTFAENALIKARAVARASGLVAIADDSGLVVDALAGAPGVYSARYANDWPKIAGESRDQRNMRKLLHAMRDFAPEQRRCHFETAMAAVHPAGCALEVTGQWHGRLLNEPLGQNGFGYDPIFWDEKLGKSAAQLDRSEKNAVSHRGKALRQLLKKWPEFEACIAARDKTGVNLKLNLGRA